MKCLQGSSAVSFSGFPAMLLESSCAGLVLRSLVIDDVVGETAKQYEHLRLE